MTEIIDLTLIEDDINTIKDLPELPDDKPCIGYIYSIMNIETEDEYIGQTFQDFTKRWKQHFCKSSQCPKISNAIKKYGKNSFKKTLIEIICCNDFISMKKQLNNRETHWIKIKDTYMNGYNMTRGNSDKDYKWYVDMTNKRRNFKCENCELKFCSDDSKRIHCYENHSGPKPFKCTYDMCKFEATFKNSFIQHTRIHTNEKPFECIHCDKSFKTSSQLKSHKRIHTGETPYKCEICGKKFKTGGNLESHMVVHSDTRPFKCPREGCCQSFKRKKTLDEHLNNDVLP